MQHLDEHTMAFFAIGAEFSSPDKDAIEAHLSECHGCRAQVEQLRAINRHVAESIDSEELSGDLPSNALVRMPRPVKRRLDTSPIRLESRSLARGVRLTALVRRHPVVAGSAGLVLAFLTFFVFRLFIGHGHATDQPDDIRMNATGSALEIYGKDTRLFNISVSATRSSEAERLSFRDRYTCIADIDGDGTMEVIAGAPYSEGGKQIYNVIRIFNHEGDLLSQWPLGSSVDFNGTTYSNLFSVGGVATIAERGSGQKEILVAIRNDRSPFCVLHMDNKGRTKGEYWHFGWLNSPVVTHVAGEERDVVLLWGTNDVGYRSNNEYPVLTILDPSKLEGRVESGQSPGFGLSVSHAEIYYVRLGNVDTALVSGVEVTKPTFSSFLRMGQDSSFTLLQTFFAPAAFPSIAYTFDKNLSLRDVWLSDGDRYKLENFLTNKTPAGSEGFLRDLRNKVEYWDGSRWLHQRTKIIPPVP